MEQQNSKKEKYEGKKLISYTVNMSGSMTGGKRTESVRISDDGSYAVLFIGNQYRYNLDMRSKLYTVNKSLLDEIADIVLEYKVYSAKIGKTNPYVVYDMPVTTYSFCYEDGISFGFSNSNELAKTFYEALNKIDALIKEYVDKGTQYPTVYAPENEFVDWKKENKISLHVREESPFSIILEVFFGCEEPKDITGDVVLSLIEDGKIVEERTLVENLTMSNIPEYSLIGIDINCNRFGTFNEKTISFQTEDYLKAGTYKIRFAGYETTFEIKIYK
ncbi:MAG: hypothetical protein PUG48_08155 [Clostridia bacterium]|nr:hypothetical protein [Clostridia bacterium]